MEKGRGDAVQEVAEHKPRMQWMDMLRGMAIALVVVHHCTIYMFEKYPEVFASFKDVSDFIAPLRMPVLFFLSGLLLAESIEKGARRYAIGKVTNLIYPFVVWTLILYLLYVAREALLGLPSEIHLTAALLHDPWHHLWFLHYLAIFYAIGFFLFKAGALVTAVVAGTLFWLEIPAGGYFTALFMFFMAGAFVNRTSALPDWILEYRTLAVWGGFAGIALCLLGVWSGLIPLSKHNLTYCIIAAAALPIVVRAAMRMERTPIAPILEYLGRHSLVLYMIHVPVGIAIPLVLEQFDGLNPLYVFPFYLAAVFAVCLGVMWLRPRSRLVELFFSAEGFRSSGPVSRQEAAR